MKKTIIALMALAGITVAGETLPTPVGSVDNVSASNRTFDTTTVTSWSGISVAMTLDTEALVNWVSTYRSGSITILTLNGGTSQGDVSGGIGTKMYFTDTEAVLKGFWGTSSTTYGASSNLAADGKLDGLTGASLVMNYGPDNGKAVDADAVLTLTYGESQSPETITFSGLKSAQWNVRGNVSVHEGIVSSFDVYNTRLTIDQAKEIGKALAPATVPEPTTATLGLLALAGLAARRRRK